jgi:tRNA (guanine-N7-)-methyltransferase
MVRRVRQHVNPHSLTHLDTGAGRLDLPREARVEVDLGCASGHFLFRRCQLDPKAIYIGVEIRELLVERINQQAAERGFRQISAVYANLHWDLEVLFAPSSVDLFTINFPDPWFKKSHKKRNMLTPRLAESLLTVLRPSGRLYFQSDVFDLALDVMAAMEMLEGRVENAHGPWSFAPRNPLGATTQRERACLKKQRRVWRLCYSKAGKDLTP